MSASTYLLPATMIFIVACADDTGGLGDAGAPDALPPEITYCKGRYYDLDTQGRITLVETDCARGAVCGEGVSFAVCAPDEARSSSYRGGVIGESHVAHAKEINPGYPFCQQATDCNPFPGADVCLLAPGCTEPEGICCGGVCIHGDGILPRELCAEITGCQLMYCGCDGLTYEGLPTRPWRYPGPCL